MLYDSYTHGMEAAQQDSEQDFYENMYGELDSEQEAIENVEYEKTHISKKRKVQQKGEEGNENFGEVDSDQENIQFQKTHKRTTKKVLQRSNEKGVQ